jgi:hypothetical protein
VIFDDDDDMMMIDNRMDWSMYRECRGGRRPICRSMCNAIGTINK